MPVWLLKPAVLAAAALVAACGAPAPTGPTPAGPTTATSAQGATALVPVQVVVPARLAQPPFDQARTALIPPGWTMSVWARTDRPRLAVTAPDGSLLISVPASGQVLRFTGSGQSAVLLDGLTQPHGLAFAGDRLYLAQSDRVDVYSYADGRAGAPTPIATGLPDAKTPELRGAYSHALKSVTVGSDGAVYFSIGSTGNISAQDRTATPPRAVIMRVPPGGGPAQAFATGVRNGTGLAVAPDGAIWTAVNNRDNIARPSDGQVSADYVNDHPPESIARLTPGRELGWPYCHPDGGPADMVLIPDVQTNPDGAQLDCAALPPIEQGMGAHSAPLGMTFVQLPAPFGAGALIGVHGSWNRTPPRAPEVSFYPWRDGTLGQQQTLVGGFQDAAGNRWGRPVAAIVGTDGAVYVTDDQADAVYRLTPPA